MTDKGGYKKLNMPYYERDMKVLRHKLKDETREKVKKYYEDESISTKRKPKPA
jgi:hypothetical protein